MDNVFNQYIEKIEDSKSLTLMQKATQLQKEGKNEKEIVIRVTGNGFLYNMVRIIAGTLIRVGRGFYEPEKIRDILEAKEHTSEGITAPPNGLVLVSIDYPL